MESPTTSSTDGGAAARAPHASTTSASMTSARTAWREGMDRSDIDIRCSEGTAMIVVALREPGKDEGRAAA